MQDQPENSISFLPEGIVIQSTRQLDLKSYICNKYVLATDYGTIYTAIRENMGIQTDLDALEVENWGFNSGPYHDILTRTGYTCLLYTSPSPRDGLLSRMPSSA